MAPSEILDCRDERRKHRCAIGSAVVVGLGGVGEKDEPVDIVSVQQPQKFSRLVKFMLLFGLLWRTGASFLQAVCQPEVVYINFVNGICSAERAER